jgi:hypothetical protein
MCVLKNHFFKVGVYSKLSNFYFFNNFLLSQKELSKLDSCFDQCAHKEERPIKKLVDWWKINSFDLDSSICILNIALKYDL